MFNGGESHGAGGNSRPLRNDQSVKGNGPPGPRRNRCRYRRYAPGTSRPGGGDHARRGGRLRTGDRESRRAPALRPQPRDTRRPRQACLPEDTGPGQRGNGEPLLAVAPRDSGREKPPHPEPQEHGERPQHHGRAHDGDDSRAHRAVRLCHRQQKAPRLLHGDGPQGPARHTRREKHLPDGDQHQHLRPQHGLHGLQLRLPRRRPLRLRRSMYGPDLHVLGLQNVMRCLGLVLDNEEFMEKVAEGAEAGKN